MKKVSDTVENSINGKPLQNAVVTLNTGAIDALIPVTLYTTNNVSGPSVSSVSTDEDGYYEFYVPDGTYIFRAAYGDIEKIVEDFEVYDESEQRAALLQAQTDIDALEADVVDLQADVAALPALAGGTYTPTLTNSANIDSSTAYSCQYMRVGSIVSVSGRVDIDQTASATQTDLKMTLPVASDFANSNELAGAAYSIPSLTVGAAVFASIADNLALIRFTSSGTGVVTLLFTFQYRII
jgi:hypothetical protein